MFKKYDAVTLTKYTEGGYPLQDDITKDDFQFLKSRQLRFWESDSKWVYFQYATHKFSEGWSTILRVLWTDVAPCKTEQACIRPRSDDSNPRFPAYEEPTYAERNPKKEAYPGWGGYYND